MAYDEGLAQRLRETYTALDNVVEKKMFGGIAFMVSGHMSCGVSNDHLMARIGPQQYEKALGMPGARPMDFTGRPMKGFVFVDPEGLESDQDLTGWVNMSLTFVRSLPPK